MRRFLLMLPLIATGAWGQIPFIDPGAVGTTFPARLAEWTPGTPWCDDENFFISRVRPAERFRNQATQVDPMLDEAEDKHLIFWVPVGDSDHTGHPAGRFDSETFTQWSYVTHYGVWNAPLAHVPAGFIDAAHRNGVAVSAVATMPFGTLAGEWKEAITALLDAGAGKMAAWLNRCGLDGIGYNSEFTCAPELMAALGEWHDGLRREMTSPVKEIIWYDGTSEDGTLMFDRGLGTHNDGVWGAGGEERTSLFFNYNWNYPQTLEKSVARAREMDRSPLDLYCGINMQGREPHNLTPGLWSLLKEYPLSIGLWGAHSANMFWEYRAEKGGSAAARHRNYLSRIERWFTGGTRNPVTARLGTADNIAHGDGNEDFPGMSCMMTARSALAWNLSERPFVTSFCLGNGRFLNLEGERQHDSEWYDMGAQDYLPTWTWWWAGEFLGRDAATVRNIGLSAEYTHDDAWTGGSSVRIRGSAHDAWLHLFKTRFPLEAGDRLTVRLKHLSGSGQVSLALSADGNEAEAVTIALHPVAGRAEWQEFTIYPGMTEGTESLSGKTLALIGLRFKEADGLDLRIGSIELMRPGMAVRVPETPVIERAEVMAAGPDGAVGKLIYNMPDEDLIGPCNVDHGVSHFNLYARTHDGETQLRGMTSTWAALMSHVSGEWDSTGARLQLGVAAVGLDGRSASPIAWSDPLETASIYDEGATREEPSDFGYPREFGAAPRILGMTSDAGKSDETVEVTAEIDVPFTTRSQGVRIGEHGYGFAYRDVGMSRFLSPHSIGFMVKADAPADDAERVLFVLRDRTDSWAANHFGTFRHLLSSDGATSRIILTGELGGDVEYYFDSSDENRLLPGQWRHVVYTFETDEAGNVRPMWYLDGKLQRPTRRVRGRSTFEDGEIPFEKHIKQWRPDNVAEVGAYVHGAVPLEGSVACMRLYMEPLLSEEEVTGIMAETSTDDVMAPVAYRDTGVEGVGELYRPEPVLTAGPPMDFGEDCPLPVDICWSVYGGRLVSWERDAYAATADSGVPGVMTVRAYIEPDGNRECRIGMKAANEFGADTTEMTLGESGVAITEPIAPAVWPSPFTDRLSVRPPHGGRWSIIMTDTAARVFLAQTFDTSDGEIITLFPDVAPGPCLLTLSDSTGTVRTINLLRR